MPAIQVRPVLPTDLSHLIAFDHTSFSDHVWQMEIQELQKEIGVFFRERRLPRTVQIDYPRDPGDLADSWDQNPGLLVAVLQDPAELPVGYVNLIDGPHRAVVHIRDLVVAREQRRKGIGTALLLAAQEWTLHHGASELLLETLSRNYPAICLAKKLGFEFCGYSDHYYANREIALFFGKSL